MLSESEVKFAFSLQYSRFYAMGGQTRTLPLAWAQLGKRRGFIKDPSTSQRMPRVTAAVVPLYSSTVIEHSPTLIHNMPIIPPVPCIPPVSTFVLETHSRDNRNARSPLTTCLNLAPSRWMCQARASLRSPAAMTRKLLQLSPVVATRKQAYPTDQAGEIGEGGKGSRGGERYRGRGSR
jgi:hypothetical protein